MSDGGDRRRAKAGRDDESNGAFERRLRRSIENWVHRPLPLRACAARPDGAQRSQMHPAAAKT